MASGRSNVILVRRIKDSGMRVGVWRMAVGRVGTVSGGKHEVIKISVTVNRRSKGYYYDRSSKR